MNIQRFRDAFDAAFPVARRDRPTHRYAWRLKLKIRTLDLKYYVFDPLRDVEGMLSVKKQRLLNLAYRLLEPNEAYLEVGTWKGKSLIAAMVGNEPRPTFACDNFLGWEERAHGRKVDVRGAFLENLRRYGLERHVVLYDELFQHLFASRTLPVPIGVYFIDVHHDEASHSQAIAQAEPFLADTALVIINDWRFAADSESYAKAGTEKAIADSSHHWRLLYELPARYNGDRAMWWNGVAVFAFERDGSSHEALRRAKSAP